MLTEKARARLERTRRSDSTEPTYAEYRDDPVGFFRDVFGIELWDKQADLAQSVADHPRTVGRSGHKVGKSVDASGLSLWWVNTREQGQVILTSSGERQVKNILWKELRRLWRLAKRRGHDLGPEPAIDPATGMRFADGVRAIYGFTTASAEKMAGFSGHELLFVVDEASGFPDDIYEAVEGNTAGGGRIVAFGNPTQTTGWFYEAFRMHADLWARHHISSEETPNVVSGEDIVPGLATREWVEMMRRKYGPDYNKNPVYQVRVLGEFPDQSADSVIAMSDVDAARGRWGQPKPGPLRVGVDVARYGDDETVITAVRGHHKYPSVLVTGADGPTVANRVIAHIKTLEPGAKQVPVNVDGIGVGASVVDALKGTPEVSVREVNVGEKATDEDYYNLRSQLWFGIGQWLSEGGTLDPDPDLERELLAARYSFDPRGRMKVEPKADIRKRLGRSPDRADALALAVYQTAAPSMRVQYHKPLQSREARKHF